MLKKLLLTALLFSPQSHAVDSTACIACHGQDGIAANTHVPHLAGQHTAYVMKRLQEVTHAPNIVPLSEKVKADLAAYYATMPAPNHKHRVTHNRRGKLLYRKGDWAKRVPACVICHGPGGLGNAAAGFPLVKGQNKEYVIKQLRAFKHKKRAHDRGHVMQTICSQLSAQDMVAVAKYIEDL